MISPPLQCLGIALAGLCSIASPLQAQLAVQGKTLHTMNGEAIANGVVLMQEGKITAVGTSEEVEIPDGFTKVEAAVVTPGIIDAHATVGLSGILNSAHDQEQLEKSAPIQPELRALDAYNGRDPLVTWLRNFGITCVNTGHAPRALISGQAMIVKTDRLQVIDPPLRPLSMVMGTLGADGLASDSGKAPGTRAKAVALLREAFLEAQSYLKKLGEEDPAKQPDRNLRLEILAKILNKETPLLLTAHRHQDIVAALRLAEEFQFDLILDGAAEAYLVLDSIKRAGVPVILHPTMMRSQGEAENMTFETAKKLHENGVLFALQSGFESYVPKTRVVLFEAGMAAAYGLPFEAALASVTRDSAKILGIDHRVGSLAVGMDADVALFDGDPFEYTTHCLGVVIDGKFIEPSAITGEE